MKKSQRAWLRSGRRSKASSTKKRLRFEQLEDRRMLVTYIAEVSIFEYTNERDPVACDLGEGLFDSGPFCAANSDVFVSPYSLPPIPVLFDTDGREEEVIEVSAAYTYTTPTFANHIFVSVPTAIGDDRIPNLYPAEASFRDCAPGADPCLQRYAFSYFNREGTWNGFVFEDENGNGESDGDVGLSGVVVVIGTSIGTVTATVDGAGECPAEFSLCAVTSEGSFSISGNVGDHPNLYRRGTGVSVDRTLPSGAGEWAVTAGSGARHISGSTVTLRPLGIFNGTTTGILFEDNNADGIADDTELPLPAGSVVFQDWDDDGNLDKTGFQNYQCVLSEKVEPCAVTDSEGRYKIEGLGLNPSGHLRAILPGWRQTSGDGTVLLRSSSTPPNHIGMIQKSTGRVFTDENGNGQQDSEDVPRSGIRVFVDIDGDGLHGPWGNRTEPLVTTDANGDYTINYVGPGTIRAISPGIPASLFTMTTLDGAGKFDSLDVFRAYDANFGVFRNVSPYGQVFYDKNGDGIRDHHLDPFLSDVTVQLDLNSDGTVDRTVTTNSIGYYEFRNVGPGTHRIVPVLHDNQKLTMPSGLDGYAITTVSSEPVGPLLFGLSDVAPLIVNSSESRGDRLPGDEKCDTGERVNGVAECTLWAAIQEANALAGRQSIEFDSAATLIDVTKPLPEITDPVKITGGEGRVILLGNTSGSGLKISAGNSTISGLTVAGFDGIGIELTTHGKNLIENSEIIGSDAEGIVIRDDSNENVIRNNRIGTGTNGSDRGNGLAGIRIHSNSNVIGGADPSDGNLIAYNAHGVAVEQGFNRIENNVIVANRDEGVYLIDGNNNVRGNYIGVDRDGVAKGNGKAGILSESEHNTIGGMTPSAGNVIANNLRGIDLTLADDNTIDNNEILANLEQGIVLRDGSDRNILRRNYIGIDRTGQKSGNGSAGIWIASSNNVIGGTEVGDGNTIAFNGTPQTTSDPNKLRGHGVVVAEFPDLDGQPNTTITGNAILANAINGNFGPGIDLGHDGTTANDLGSQQPLVFPDTDSGPNTLQNVPDLAALIFENQLVGRLHSTPNASFHIQFFLNELVDVLEGSEGAKYLGFIDVVSDATGTILFTAPPFTVGPTQVVTATASRRLGDGTLLETSEFSSPATRDADTCSNASLQQIKVDFWQAIQRSIDRVGEVDTAAAQHLRQLAQRSARLQPDGCILASTEALGRISTLVSNHLRALSDDGWWQDFKEIFGEDYDRMNVLLSESWIALWDQLALLYDDPVYRDRQIVAFDDLLNRTLDGTSRELSALTTDLWTHGGSILFEFAVLMGKDLRTVDFYTKLVSDALAFELFAKVMDPKVPVEQRIGLYMLAVVQVAGTLEGGGTVGKGLLETTRLKVLADRLAKSFAGESVLADTLAVTMRKRIDAIAAGNKVRLRDLLNGEEVPIEIMDELGWTPAQINALRQISIDEGIFMQFRTTNPKSAKFVRDGLAGTKPVDIKAKTINDVDVYLGFDSKHQGLVGLKDPTSFPDPRLTSPCVQNDEPLCTSIKERFAKHDNDWDELISKLDTTKYRIEPDGRIFDIATNKPIAGDIDPVAFLDADGNNISGPAYDALVQRLKLSAAQIQHGAETNIVDDVIKALKNACDQVPPSPKCAPEGSEKWFKEVQDAIDLKRDQLEPAHYNGKEVTFEFGPDGRIRRRVITSLPDVGSAEGEVASFEPVPKEQLIRLFADMDIDIRRDQLTTFDLMLAAIEQRNVVKFGSLISRLHAAVPDVGIDESAFRIISPAEFVDLVESQPRGLQIAAVSLLDAINNGEGEGERQEEGEDGLTREEILEKLRLAVGDSGMKNYLVAARDNGSFIVHSRFAQQRPFDVNGNGNVSAVDALIIINRLNAEGTQQLRSWPTELEVRMDVNLDGYWSAVDALQVINFLNAATFEPAAEGEGIVENPTPWVTIAWQSVGNVGMAINSRIELDQESDTATPPNIVAPIWDRPVNTTVSALTRLTAKRSRELSVFDDLEDILNDFVPPIDEWADQVNFGG